MDSFLKQLISGDNITVNDNITYELLADVTVGTVTTSVDIPNLDIQQDEEIVLVATIINNSGTNGFLYAYANNNTTTTNYYSQRIRAFNTTVSAERQNNATIGTVYTGNTFRNVNIKITNNGFFVCQSSMVERHGTLDTALNNTYATSTFTMTNLNRLTFTSSITNSIDVGSRFQLYKINGGDKTWTTL